MSSFSENLVKALQSLRSDYDCLPGPNEDLFRYDKHVKTSFPDNEIKNITDFEEERSFRYIVRTPATPIILDRQHTLNQILSVGEINDMIMSISYVGPFARSEYVRRTANDEPVWSPAPTNEQQRKLMSQYREFVKSCGLEEIDDAVLKCIVQDLETDSLAPGEATIADLIF